MTGGRRALSWPPMTRLRNIPIATLVGLTALAFSALYLFSDVIEAIQGGFSTSQLGLTLVAEAAIPVFVIGLYVVQRPQIGAVGRISAVAYAYSYVFFTGTVVYALIDGTSDYSALSHDLQPWMTIHGAVMVLAGLGFGFAVMRARVLPRWTAITLMAGVVLVSLSQSCLQARRCSPPRSATSDSPAWAPRCWDFTSRRASRSCAPTTSARQPVPTVVLLRWVLGAVASAAPRLRDRGACGRRRSARPRGARADGSRDPRWHGALGHAGLCRGRGVGERRGARARLRRCR